MNVVSDHLSVEQLLAYWLHETDAEAAAAADEHLMRCDDCGRRLDELVALRDGVRAALRAGKVMAVTSSAFVQRLAGEGLQVREYRLPHNGSVHCTVAPNDEVLVVRLEAPLQGVQRLDAVARLSLQPGVEFRVHDVPFDADAGEVLYVAKLAAIRPLPAHTLQLTLLAAGSDGPPREVGRYDFHHRPWPAGAAPPT